MVPFTGRARMLGGAFDRMQTVLSRVSGVLLVVMMLCISYEVVMRYFFLRPTRWVNDISGYIQFAVTFIAAAWVLREEGHVSIDIVISRLKPKTQALSKFVTSLVGVVICGVFAWKSFEAAWVAYESGYKLIRGIIIPEHIILWFVPLGMSLLCVQFVLRAGRSFKVSQTVSASVEREP